MASPASFLANLISGGAPTSGIVLTTRPLERLDRRPYSGESTCAVVDAHASGLFMTCGGASVELRDARTKALARAFEAPDVVLAARFSPSGRVLVLGGLDQRATAYDVESGKVIGATPRMDDFCDEIAWLGRSHRFAIASQRGEVWIVDALTMRPTARLLGPDPGVADFGGIASSADGSVLYASLGTSLIAFDAASGTMRWRRDECLDWPSRLAVSATNDVLVAANEGVVELLDAGTGRSRQRLVLDGPCGVSWPDGEQRDDRAWSLRPRACPRGDRIAFQDRVGNLAFLDASTGVLRQLPRADGRAFIEDLAWLGDAHLVLGASDSTLAIWRVEPLGCVMKSHAILAS